MLVTILTTVAGWIVSDTQTMSVDPKVTLQADKFLPPLCEIMTVCSQPIKSAHVAMLSSLQVFEKWLDKNDPEPLRYRSFDGFKWHKLIQHQYHSLNPRKYNPMTNKSKMIGKCVDHRFLIRQKDTHEHTYAKAWHTDTHFKEKSLPW